jgi:hypothetical protein
MTQVVSSLDIVSTAVSLASLLRAGAPLLLHTRAGCKRLTPAAEALRGWGRIAKATLLPAAVAIDRLTWFSWRRRA